MKSSFASRLSGTPGIVVPRQYVSGLYFSRRFRNAKRFRMLPLVLALSAASLIAEPLPGHAACTPAGTDIADLIACSGTHTAAINAGAGDDSITVPAGASVDVSSSNSATPTVAIDAGADNDTVTNLGSVSAASTQTQSQSPFVPMPDPGIGLLVTDNPVSATAVAIAGGSGNDTLDNGGTLATVASTTTSTVSVPLTVQGGDTVIATTTVEAKAIGIGGDSGTDTASNNGILTSSAATEITSINVEHNLIDASHGNASTSASATAIGMIGGDGAGSLTQNSGTINSTAAARSLGVNVEINAADAATVDAALTVDSTAVGVQSGLGGGVIENTGAITTSATSNVLDVGVNASYLDITIADRDVSDVSTTLNATVTGIDAASSAGPVAITHAGSIDALATSTVHAIAIALASEGVPAPTETLVTKFGIASVGIFANSHANGIVGGDADDTIDSSGTISASATANARQDSINVGMALITYPIPTPGIVLGSAGTEAYAQAAGLDGGAGDDAITNNNLVSANADASASALTVSVNLSGFTDNSAGFKPLPGLGSIGASFAVADTTTQATATATGIQGGTDNDTVQNNSTVSSTAQADGGSIAVAATMNVEFKEGENLFSGNAAGARSVTQTNATAIGIDGGTGVDALTNDGSVTANAEADANTVSVSITVAGTVRGKGGALNLAATDTSGLGNATATGMQGGAGDDTVLNSGTILATSDADVSSVSAAVSIGFAKQGLVADVALARSESIATATSTGIDGGEGHDGLTNANTIDARANAEASAISVSIAVSGTADGVSIAAALAKADGQATASATGVDGGAGNDIIRNSAVIDINNVSADALAASIAVELSGTNNGVAAGFSLADSSANAAALATGLEGGGGDDDLTNTSSITIRDVRAETDAVSVAVSLNASLNAGVAAGVAMTDTSTNSNVTAKGISGGDGNDLISNTGTITANNNIGAEADATSVSVSGQMSMAGVAISAALSDASANAVTTVAGIDGGAGDDAIDNRGAINLNSRSNVETTSVSIAINAALGVGGGAELVDAQANSTNTVTGIDGGTGRNDIANSARIEVRSEADADSLSIGLGVTLALGGDATLVEATANANATAVGIGDTGSTMAAGTHGSITNTNLLSVTTDASVVGKAISGNLRGYALGETSITGIADGYGIRSGEGATIIDNRGGIGVNSQATANGLSVAVTLAGKAMGDANAIADARATGISAGADDDQVLNSAGMNLTAQSSAEATAVSVTLAGTARTDVQTQALTTATGIDGSAGHDQLSSSGFLGINAFSNTRADSVQVSLLGTTGSDVVNTPMSRATAMSGGDGNDTVTLLAGSNANIRSSSSAEVSSSSWVVAGTSGSRAGVDASAYATGLDGGSGADTLINRNNFLNIESSASAYAFSSAWTFAGTSGAEAALLARTRAAGLDGGDGADTLRNEGSFNVSSFANLDATGGGNAIFGNASTNTDIGADATALGLSGGAGNDRIDNLAMINIFSSSNVNSTRSSFTFAGGADIDELLKSKSTAIGIDGGAGDDVIYNDSLLTRVDAYAAAITNGSASAMLGGGAAASGKAVAEAIATGISGGDGVDQIENRGALTVTATIAPQTNNSSSAGVFFGGGQAQGWVFGTINAAGIDGGDGDNAIVNRDSLTVNAFTFQDTTIQTARAFTFASGADFSLFTGGNANAFSETEVNADAAGIRAGNGDNVALNTGAIQVHIGDTLAASHIRPDGGGVDSGRGDGTSNSFVVGRASGMQFGDGDNTAINDGTIDVYASPKTSATTHADGRGVDSSAVWVASSARGYAWGIRAGNGDSIVVSNGAIHVTAAPLGESGGHSDGGGLSGNGRVTVGTNAHGNATGISVGDGNSTIENYALLSVNASPVSRPINNDVNAIAIGHIDGDADAVVDSQAHATAVGIDAGIGSHAIFNTSTIEVTAVPSVTAGYFTGAGGGVNGHAGATLYAYASARASGLRLGSGDAYIVNTGNITVNATPSAGLANIGGDGGPFIGLETWGVANGITVDGAGNQTVRNSGTIDVAAIGSIQVSNDCCIIDPESHRQGGVPSAHGVQLLGSGHKELVNDGTIRVNAEAFYTPLSWLGFGGPEDFVQASAVEATGTTNTVVNNGTIISRYEFSDGNNSISDFGYAVRLGNGDDMLRLGATSVTAGNIAFGAGNATLVLTGTPQFNGSISNDTSRDFSLVLNDSGSWAYTLPMATQATKNGLGTYTLPTLNSVRHLEVNQGTLQVGGGYTFRSDGMFQAGIYTDGSNGRFATEGVATLGGELRIVQGGGLYRQGMAFDVLTAADGIAAGSSFSDIDLPAPTALVSFQSQQMADRLRISTDVRSIASVAGNGVAGNDLAIANHLDQIMNAGPGDFTGLFESLQSLTDPAQFESTFASLDPAAFSNGPTAALHSNQRFSNALLSCRVREGDNRFVAEGECGWGKVQGRKTRRDATTNSAAADEKGVEISAGVQKAVGENWYAGFGLSYEDSELTTADLAMSDGERFQLGGILKAVYGDATFSLSLSGGQGRYDSRRNLTVPVPGTVATATQKIDFVSSHLRAGYAFGGESWYLRPLVDFGVSRTRLGAFTETGAGAANLSVQEQKETYVSVLPAVEFGTEWQQGDGTLIRPFASIGVTHYLTGTNPEITAILQGAPAGVAPFTVSGEMDETFGNLTLGMDFLGSDGKDVRVTYDGQFSDHTASHSFALKLSVPF